ncbi:hypothetical protein K438DRAFT_1014393 [Mycena galopus ATCC 62051]|nr:hypothetical protein K438DRAFT_1014393 [Mycena galopus ATCC 62051]
MLAIAFTKSLPGTHSSSLLPNLYPPPHRTIAAPRAPQHHAPPISPGTARLRPRHGTHHRAAACAGAAEALDTADASFDAHAAFVKIRPLRVALPCSSLLRERPSLRHRCGCASASHACATDILDARTPAFRRSVIAFYRRSETTSQRALGCVGSSRSCACSRVPRHACPTDRSSREPRSRGTGRDGLAMMILRRPKNPDMPKGPKRCILILSSSCRSPLGTIFCALGSGCL